LKKQVIILIGLKGSGKTYIGTMLQDKIGIQFFRVEDIWLSHKSVRVTNKYIQDGFTLVEQEIDRLLINKNRITIESTGTTKCFIMFLERLKTKYDIKLIKVQTSPELCLTRIKSRDLSVHVPVSDDIVTQINQDALKVDLNYDLIIDNERSSDNEILKMIQEVI
jgi:shikimate kinase